MITPDMIPDEVAEALHISLADDAGVLVLKGDCVTAIAAALQAWPEFTIEFRRDSFMGWNGNLIILPLPQKEKGDQ